MTPQQAKTLTFLKTYSAERAGVMPSYDEIAAHLGIRSKSGVSRLIDALVARRAIRRTAGHRSIEIAEAPDAVAAERERCAKLSEDYAELCQHRNAAGAAAGREIAKAIRSRA